MNMIWDEIFIQFNVNTAYKIAPRRLYTQVIYPVLYVQVLLVFCDPFNWHKLTFNPCMDKSSHDL